LKYIAINDCTIYILCSEFCVCNTVNTQQLEGVFFTPFCGVFSTQKPGFSTWGCYWFIENLGTGEGLAGGAVLALGAQVCLERVK